MASNLVVAGVELVPEHRRPIVREALGYLAGKRSPETRRAYLGDAIAFGRFLAARLN